MADDSTHISTEARTDFGKGAARRVRREGKVPAVLYGHGMDPVHIALPSHDVFLAVRFNENALFTLDLDGKKQLALVKDVQRDPVKRTIDHLDLVAVRKGEKVTVDVPVTTGGEAEAGTIVSVETQALTVDAPAIAIPEEILVDVEGLADGAVVRIEDIKLPEDVTCDLDPETVLVVVSLPRMETVEEDAEEGEATEEAAEEAAE